MEIVYASTERENKQKKKLLQTLHEEGCIELDSSNRAHFSLPDLEDKQKLVGLLIDFFVDTLRNEECVYNQFALLNELRFLKSDLEKRLEKDGFVIQELQQADSGDSYFIFDTETSGGIAGSAIVMLCDSLPTEASLVNTIHAIERHGNLGSYSPTVTGIIALYEKDREQILHCFEAEEFKDLQIHVGFTRANIVSFFEGVKE